MALVSLQNSVTCLVNFVQNALQSVCILDNKFSVVRSDVLKLSRFRTYHSFQHRPVQISQFFQIVGVFQMNCSGRARFFNGQQPVCRCQVGLSRPAFRLVYASASKINDLPISLATKNYLHLIRPNILVLHRQRPHYQPENFAGPDSFSG